MTCGSGCSTLGEMIKRLGASLADPEHDAWEEGMLVDFVNEALCDLHHRRPDAFASTEHLLLDPGSGQTLPTGVSAIVDVKANVTFDVQGRPIEGRTVNAVSSRYAHLLTSRNCVNPTSTAYAVSEVIKDTFNPLSFTVKPPVPEGQKHYIRATVVMNPTTQSLSHRNKCLGVACKFEPALVQYVLYRALAIDSESGTNLSASQVHYKTYESLMQAEYLQAQRYGSGYALGINNNTPQADPQFRQR